MDRSVAFYLVRKTREQDAFGQYHEEIKKRYRYGQIGSVSMQEFYAAGQNGFKPEYRITMFGPDYEGEDELILDGVPYFIYRVYRARTDKVELYIERRAGETLTEEEDAEESAG